MKENEEVFGNTSFDDVKSQMDLYEDWFCICQMLDVLNLSDVECI